MKETTANFHICTFYGDADNVIFSISTLFNPSNPAHANILLIHRSFFPSAAAVPSLTHPNLVQASLSYYDLCVIYEPNAAAAAFAAIRLEFLAKTGWLHFHAAPNK